MLESYQHHPGCYDEMVTLMIRNRRHLPQPCIEMYETEEKSKLILRIRTKVQRLMADQDSINDADIK